MTTRPYSDLLASVEALCGADLATAERNRVKLFVNRRARKAYAESRYWPRFLKVEERVISEDGLLPYEETGLSTIGTVFRIHATEPYERTTSLEYIDFAPIGTGIQVANYQRRAATSGLELIVVTGGLNPNVADTYEPVNGVAYGDTTIYEYVGTGNTTNVILPSVSTLNGEIVSIDWTLGQDPDVTGGLWFGDQGLGLTPQTPADVSTWVSNGTATGDPIVNAQVVYSVWVTYKAALPDTYGDGVGEESDVPEEWFDYLISAAYSDFLRNDGQNEKAAMEEAAANEFLQQQLERLDTSGSFLFGKILNHNNTQWR